MTSTVGAGGSGRPGRPRLAPDELAERRRAVTEAARTLFTTEGYAAVSIRRVAQLAGVTPKTLYSYFDSKLELLLSLWSETFSELFDELARIDDGDDLERLIAVCSHYVRYWIERPDHYRLVFMSAEVSQAAVTDYIERSGITQLFDVFTTPLVSMLDLDQHAVRDRSELLICALQGIVHSRVTMSGYEWAPFPPQVDTLVRSIITS